MSSGSLEGEWPGSSDASPSMKMGAPGPCVRTRESTPPNPGRCPGQGQQGCAQIETKLCPVHRSLIAMSGRSKSPARAIHPNLAAPGPSVRTRESTPRTQPQPDSTNPAGSANTARPRRNRRHPAPIFHCNQLPPKRAYWLRANSASKSPSNCNEMFHVEQFRQQAEQPGDRRAVLLTRHSCKLRYFAAA
jgi:hypothetical protein